MKARVRRDAFRSPSFYTYLKPGALAQLRYSKITARSKENETQVLRELSRIQSGSVSASPQPHSMEGFPCFGLRVSSYPRCLQRKKLVAVTPFFSETQS